jgi:hypothetical protein
MVFRSFRGAQNHRHRGTELFAHSYKSYGPATVRYPVFEVVARVEPFENGRGYLLRVLGAGQRNGIASRSMRTIPSGELFKENLVKSNYFLKQCW